MIWMIVCAVLASAGLLLIVWALLGWCVLPPRREAVTIYRLSASEPQLERQVRAFVWSRRKSQASAKKRHRKCPKASRSSPVFGV